MPVGDETVVANGRSAHGCSVLLIDDDELIGRVLVRTLRGRSFDAHWRDTTSAGMAALRASEYDALLLDWRMPLTRGPDACRLFRLGFPDLAILVFTVADEHLDRLAAFEAGADDYVLKRTHIDELCARIGAVHKRRYINAGLTTAAPSGQTKGSLAYGPIRVDLLSYRLFLSGVPVCATMMELRFMVLLVLTQGKPVGYADIIAFVFDAIPADVKNSLKVIATRIRQKLRPIGVALVNDAGCYALSIGT